MKRQTVHKVKQGMKHWLSRLCLSDGQEIQRAVDNASAVSFDIFDTLIKRDVPTPADVHVLVGRRYALRTGSAPADYLRRRLAAEQEARLAASGREITLQEIFSHFEGLSEQEKADLQELEQETEYDVCTPNLTIKPVYERAAAAGKTILVASDMYLPESLICRMLEKCGYKGYDRLYLSSSLGVTKSSGKLFDALLAQEGFAPEKLCHIGDNVKADFYRAGQRKINACLIAAEQKNLDYYRAKEMRTWEERAFYAFLNNHKPTRGEEAARCVGYEILGPMLWGFTAWLHGELLKMKPDKVFFLSREGALLERAYKVMYPDSPFRLSYLYVSRQAVQTPLIGACRDYNELLQLLKPLMHIHSLENVGKCCGFDARYLEGLAALGLRAEENAFDLPHDKRQLWFALVMKLGRGEFARQRGLVRQYLAQEGFAGRVAVVDIGWQGTMQKALLAYAKDSVTQAAGFYLGVFGSRFKTADYEKLDRRGWLFEPDGHSDSDLRIRFTCEVLELMFLNQDGSTARYVSEDGKISPCLGTSGQTAEADKLMGRIQQSALEFLRELMLQRTGAQSALTCEFVMRAYDRFAVHPTLKTLRYFRGFNVLDTGVHTILPEHSTLYYLVRPRRIAEVLEGGGCKVFVMKSIFRLPLPYFELLCFIKNRVGFRTQFQRNMEK